MCRAFLSPWYEKGGLHPLDENDKPIPYFEYYDGEECYRYYMDESEQMMADIKKFLES